MSQVGGAEFPPDYATSRREFRDSAAKLGWRQESYRIDGEGPSGEELTIDFAASTSAGSDRLLVISSGLHGVEAPIGSAVQISLMRRWMDATLLPSNLRCLMIHSLNPFGFAWSRRFDGDNIDTNRNFLLDTEEYRGGSELYNRFAKLLNPKRPPSRRDMFLIRAAWAVARFGKDALKQAIATGQYDHPKGIFYGGGAPSQTKSILDRNLRRWVGDPKFVTHLDFHTGLGDWGTCKLLVDDLITPAERRRLAQWFGEESFEEPDAHGVAYQTRGSLGKWCRAQGFAPEYLFVFAEFGTYGNIRVLSGVRAENQAHHWSDPADPRIVRAKANLRELFCPASSSWRCDVLATAMDLVDRAIAGMQGDA